MTGCHRKDGHGWAGMAGWVGPYLSHGDRGREGGGQLLWRLLAVCFCVQRQGNHALLLALGSPRRVGLGAANYCGVGGK